MSELAKSLAGKETVGFFHPYCAAGGGGERVLWCAINAIQREHPGVHSVVYTGDVNKSRAEMLNGAESTFGISLCHDTVHFVFLTRRSWVEASTWPRFTLLGQSLGSIYLGWEAICAVCPDIMIDSMGYAFTFPVFKLGGCRIGCYVHYPTISTDMLDRVRTRAVGVCNDDAVARSALKSWVKLIYYRCFAFLYGIMGAFAEMVMVNSSWTRGHIDSLWKIPKQRICTVFPPCDTAVLADLPLERSKDPLDSGGSIVLSLAQFRPEKDHALQVRAFAAFLKDAPQYCAGGTGLEHVRLVMAGGCRDDGDHQRFQELESLVQNPELGLRLRNNDTAKSGAWDVALLKNLSNEEKNRYFGSASVGLHTMREEHFGISVVDFMAAGAIILAHDSGGPAMDIVVPLDGNVVGYRSSDAASYAYTLTQIFAMRSHKRLQLATLARKSVVDRFSQKAFEDQFASRMIAPLRQQ